ncbi:hypothetical protein GCM10009000_027020 [Halobacterium noricense]
MTCPNEVRLPVASRSALVLHRRVERDKYLVAINYVPAATDRWAPLVDPSEVRRIRRLSVSNVPIRRGAYQADQAAVFVSRAYTRFTSFAYTMSPS